MKTISPKTLVAIKPAVLQVGSRPSPGVYSCPCCAAPTPSECTPVSLEIPIYNFPIGSYSIDYQINNGEVTRWTFNPPIDWNNPTIHSTDLFGALLQSDYSQGGISEEASIVGGGGGIGAFMYYSGNLSAAGAPLSDTEFEYAASNTITFFAVSGQLNDPINTLFNTASVTVHSCGVIYWPGL